MVIHNGFAQNISLKSVINNFINTSESCEQKIVVEEEHVSVTAVDYLKIIG